MALWTEDMMVGGLAQAPHGKQGFYQVSGNTGMQLSGETGGTIYVVVFHAGEMDTTISAQARSL